MHIQDLAARFEQASLQYATLKQSCEQQVHSWKWASDQIHAPHPFYFLRYREHRGRWLRSRPQYNTSPYQYGFDSLNRIIVIRTFLGSSENCYEEFFTYHEQFIEGTYYSYNEVKTPINVTGQRINNGKVVTFERFAMYGRSTETYTYQQDILVAISQRGTARNTGSFSEEYLFDYDQQKKLKTITRTYSNMSTEIVYRRPLPLETIPALSEKLEQLLVANIPRIIADAHITEPMYCLVLAYDGESKSYLPPLLGLGQEKERRQWLERGDIELKYYLWNPAEFEIYDTPQLHIADAVILETCDILNQEIALKGAYHVVRRLLVNVARHLLDVQWKDILPCTDDFVIAVTEFELSDIRRNMREILSKDVWQSIKERGFI